MITVRFSKRKELIIPEYLGELLSLHEGDRVEVQCQDDTLQIQRSDDAHYSGQLTDLSKIISFSRPIGSVDVEKYMNRRGYEQLHARSNL
jgi:bifunctional DNA-binding transcriptional regulator/antitoxin component of YhaV-PrlF toxin-antitoxin module